MSLDQTRCRELLAIARASIERALPRGELADYDTSSLPAELLERRSSFITLRANGALRGCCGTVDAPRPLALDVWRNAWASAFGDRRFAPLSVEEWPNVRLHVSILSRPEPLPAVSEQGLLDELAPFTDGLILELKGNRATFLPAVWEQFGDPASFVRQLKVKAGWPAQFWSAEMRAWRYSTQSFGE